MSGVFLPQRAQRLSGFVVLGAVWSHAKPRSREGDAGRLFWVCVRVVLPPHPRPLSPVGGEGCHGWFWASDEGRFFRHG